MDWQTFAFALTLTLALATGMTGGFGILIVLLEDVKPKRFWLWISLLAVCCVSSAGAAGVHAAMEKSRPPGVTVTVVR